MSFQGPVNSSENENMCVVCFKNVDIYSVGICDHPVCFECSTRMRVLCRQKECPICRQELPKVIFCFKVEPFRKLKAQQVEDPKLSDAKNGIWFQNPEIKDAYYHLLEHNCKICKTYGPFRNFNQLKEHMRREHELHYCDLCVTNLRIFTWERRCYTRSELAQHRRKGDVDDTSHRGHPLCEFCDTRYMDSDELFRHLRRAHLYCHICDADGLHHYYPSYDCLREHFKNEHYLCEEGDCINEEFTKVFRTDIDLKAHKALEHGKHLGKAASKQARTLELEFTLAPRPRPEQQANRGGRKPQPSNNGIQNEREQQDEGAVGYEHTIHTEPGGSRGGITLRAQDFPSLGGAPASNVPLSRPPGGNVTIRHIRRGQEGLARTNENFPALSGDSSTLRFSVNSTVLPQDHQTTSTPNVSIHVNHRPNGAITTHISQNTSTSNNTATSASSTSTSSSVRVRPRSTTDAFPALGGSVKVPMMPEAAQWVKVSKNSQPKEPKPKLSKIAPAPVLPSRDSPTDFPSLSGSNINITSNTNTNTISSSNSTTTSNSNNKKSEQKEKPKKSSTLTMPVSNSWIQEHHQQQQQQTENKSANSKSKKKKPKTCSNNNDTNIQTPKQQTIQKSITTSASENNNKQTTNNNNNKTNNKKTENQTQQQQQVVHAKQNGIVKKRSELKIDSLHISDASTSNHHHQIEDFPSLGGSGGGSSNSNNSKPPPGFQIQAPPGFAANDLTFTNSSGESYSILPTHQFYAPPDFQNRNKRLVESFMNSLQTNEAILEFKNLSGMFRNGMYTAEQYYAHCKQVMKSDFAKIFPELLVLLPDIDKQQELYTIHCKNVANKKGLDVCATCRQVLSNNDLRNHLATHALENHFPALGSSSQEISSVWKK